LENPQDYPLIPDALCDPKRWSFQNQVQFLVTKVKHQIEMMRYDGLIIQEMDASATHEIWTPTLRTLNWITSDEEKIINELFSIIHLSDALSPPTHYVILAGSVETLKERVQARGVSIEVTSPFFLQLLTELECQIIPFAKQLSVPHLIINADKLRLTKEGNFPSRLVDKVLAFLSE
jgi:deoxyadenosine/deoxycytidine kinase